MLFPGVKRIPKTAGQEYAGVFPFIRRVLAGEQNNFAKTGLSFLRWTPLGKLNMQLGTIKEQIVSRVLLIVLCLNTIFWSLLGGLLSLIDRKGNLAHSCNRKWARLNLLLGGYQVDFQGAKNFAPSRAYVVVSNHQALFDIVMLLGLLPLQFRFVSKKENFKIPFLGWAMRFARYIELDRQRLRAAMDTLARCADVLSQGTSVAIFPEGTRSRDGRMQRFRRGPFQLALRARVPILPVTILGTQKAISQKGLHIVPCPVKMIVSKPVEVTDYEAQEVKRLMEDTHRIIKEEFDKHHGDYFPFN
jgi:1-acyl-sn-glycerol-3-phosphate acyltransferase